MSERNPFAAPTVAVADAAANKPTQCARDGKFVVLQKGSDLPPRCVRCNAPAQLPITTVKIHWHNPWLFFLLAINIIVYGLVAMAVRKSFTLSPGLCEEHAAARKRRLWSGLLVGVAAVVGTFMAVDANQDLLTVALALAAAAAFVFAGISSRKVYGKRITEDYARVGGCKEPFLASFES